MNTKESNKQKQAKKLGSIKTKVFLIFVFITLTSILLNSTLNYLQYRKTIKNQMITNSSQTIREINNGLTRYINSLEQMVNTVAHNPSIHREAMPILKGLVDYYDIIDNAYIASESEPLIIYPAQQGIENEDFTTRPWYKSAMQSPNQLQISAVYMDLISKEPIITISTTLLDKKVLAMDINLKSLADELSKSVVGTTGYLIVTDNTGVVLSHKEIEKAGGTSLADTDIWQTIATNTEGFINDEIDGAKKYISFNTNALTHWKIIGVMEHTELTAVIEQLMIIALLSLIGITIVVAIISILMSRWVGEKINYIMEIFSKVAEGDLTPRMDLAFSIEVYNLSDAFNRTMERISIIMKDTAYTSNKVEETSQHFAHITEQTNEAVSEVAAAIGQITVGANNVSQEVIKGNSGMQQMQGHIASISNHIKEVNEITQNTHKISNDGLEIIRDLGRKSTEAKEATQGIQELMEQMTSNAVQINSISDVISGITEQTNLLALNASIEAARAGEAGRGFAVVADEIRKLAEESQSSTEKIKAILNQTQEIVKAANTNIDSTITVIDAENKAVDLTINTFNELLVYIDTLMEKSHTIQGYMDKVSSSGNDLSLQIERISNETQDTTASTEEVNASIEEISSSVEDLVTGINGLKEMSQNLNEIISHFKIK
ncbi:MAG: methyl-accepting chemotaxis protein [Cellulosilyticum sp.]|nr:methyl-accepting chemotaxis protein [Cellulosilyticum sp.]